MLAFDIYKHNIVDDLISPRFVRNVQNAYNFRESTMQLLIEPRHSTVYLTNQPLDRLIRLINEHKLEVTKCNDRLSFKNKIVDKLGINLLWLFFIVLWCDDFSWNICIFMYLWQIIQPVFGGGNKFNSIQFNNLRLLFHLQLEFNWIAAYIWELTRLRLYYL